MGFIKIKIVLACFLSLTILGGCGTASQNQSQKTDQSQAMSNTAGIDALTFKDQTDAEVTLPKKPERIVILNNELTQLFYQVGGKAVGIATSAGVDIPEEAKGVQQVGEINHVSMEKLLSLKPDLVIGNPFFHQQLAPSFKDAHIPFAMLTVKSIEDIRRNAALLGQIIGKEDQAQNSISKMDSQLSALTKSLPDQQPTYAIITLMANNISLQKDSSIALDIANALHMRNIAETLPAGKMPSSVPFSMETLASMNPDFLFIVVHGSDEDGQRMIRSQLESNPAWKSLQAVSSGQLHILPPSMFVTTPGLNISESLEYMRTLVYPSTAHAKP
ncbi:ABC transporter substrate-binding protein [Paenibacillus terrae]|uniref:ABC transporter substrate-binding protein n=1 Tax=Paenibacillus terrae TaxID=159743 RepID=UPI0006978C0E|nr:ABC transporter substrate-binding protein [Paenibacillus terrae]